MYYNIKGGGHISPSWFLCDSSILMELEFGDVGASGGKKPGGERFRLYANCLLERFVVKK